MQGICQVNRPCCLNVFDAVRETMRQAMDKARRKEPVELEFRLGQTDGNRFRAGVPREAFELVVQRLDSSRDFTRKQGAALHPDDDGWYVTYVYLHLLPGTQTLVRTESVLRGVNDVAVTHTRKISERRQSIATGSALVDFRVSLAREEVVDAGVLADDVVPRAVYIKQRKDYHLCPTGHNTPGWTYSVTRRAVGRTLQEAELAYKEHRFTYEIELEAANDYLAHPDSKADYLAFSLLLKACDLLAMVDPALANYGQYDMVMKK